MNSLGMVETIGYSSAVVVLDQMLKTSNVKFLKLEKVKSGFVTLFVEGQVSDVKTAVESGKNMAIASNTYVSSSVIARAGQGLEKIILKEDITIENKIVNNEKEKSSEITTDSIEPVEKISEELTSDINTKKYNIENLKKTTVSSLRTMLRKEKLPEIQSNKIKFMDKASLIKHLSNIAN